MEPTEEVNCRVQLELERMNGASEEINKLQNELDEARNRFRSTLTSSTHKLNDLLKRNKKSIQRTRTYFDSKAAARKAQADAQQAAVVFRRSSSVYLAAKETVQLAEKRLEETGVQFDEAWQEMLNHNTMKMMESEKEKIKSDLEHHRKSSVYMSSEQVVAELEKKQRRSIARSKSYYDQKAELEVQLEQQKQNVDDLQLAISAANIRYKQAMAALENISEGIHLERKRSAPGGCPPRPVGGDSCEVGAPPEGAVREPGVGCEDEPDGNTAESLENEIAKHLMSLRQSAALDLAEEDNEFSSDVDSIYSFDSTSRNSLTLGSTGGTHAANHSSRGSINRPDTTSLLSESDSAINSPKSGTLERGLTAPEHCAETHNHCQQSPSAHRPLKRMAAVGISKSTSLDSVSEPTPVDDVCSVESTALPQQFSNETGHGECEGSRLESSVQLLSLSNPGLDTDTVENIQPCKKEMAADETAASDSTRDSVIGKPGNYSHGAQSTDRCNTDTISADEAGKRSVSVPPNKAMLKNLILDPAKLQSTLSPVSNQ